MIVCDKAGSRQRNVRPWHRCLFMADWCHCYILSAGNIVCWEKWSVTLRHVKLWNFEVLITYYSTKHLLSEMALSMKKERNAKSLIWLPKRQTAWSLKECSRRSSVIITLRKVIRKLEKRWVFVSVGILMLQPGQRLPFSDISSTNANRGVFPTQWTSMVRTMLKSMVNRAPGTVTVEETKKRLGQILSFVLTKVCIIFRYSSLDYSYCGTRMRQAAD